MRRGEKRQKKKRGCLEGIGCTIETDGIEKERVEEREREDCSRREREREEVK